MMTRFVRLAAAAVIVALAACSSSTAPEEPLPGDVGSYRYTVLHGKRFYEVSPVPPTGAVDTVIDSVFRTSVDTIDWVDSIGIIHWVQSYRAIRRFTGALDTNGYEIVIDTAAVFRRVGIVNGRLYDDPSITDAVLVEPLTLGATWLPRGDSSLIASVLGEVKLTLKTGAVRTYHVQVGGLSEAWWAVGLGRVQYEEIAGQGQRVRGILIGLGSP